MYLVQMSRSERSFLACEPTMRAGYTEKGLDRKDGGAKRSTFGEGAGGS